MLDLAAKTVGVLGFLLSVFTVIRQALAARPRLTVSQAYASVHRVGDYVSLIMSVSITNHSSCVVPLNAVSVPQQGERLFCVSDPRSVDEALRGATGSQRNRLVAPPYDLPTALPVNLSPHCSQRIWLLFCTRSADTLMAAVSQVQRDQRARRSSLPYKPNSFLESTKRNPPDILTATLLLHAGRKPLKRAFQVLVVDSAP